MCFQALGLSILCWQGLFILANKLDPLDFVALVLCRPVNATALALVDKYPAIGIGPTKQRLSVFGYFVRVVHNSYFLIQ